MSPEKRTFSISHGHQKIEREKSEEDEVNKFWSVYSKGLIINQDLLLSEGVTTDSLSEWEKGNLIRRSNKNTSLLIFTSKADDVANQLFLEEKAYKALIGAADLAEVERSDDYFKDDLRSNRFKDNPFLIVKQNILNIISLNDNKNVVRNKRADKLDINNEEYQGLLRRIGLIIKRGYFNLINEPEFEKVKISLATMSEMSGLGWYTIAIRLYPFANQIKFPKSDIEIKNAKFPFGIFSQAFRKPFATTPIENWLNLNNISDKLGVTYIWILRRIYKIPNIGEFRIQDRNRVLLCFPEEIVNQLEKQLYQEYDPNHEYNIAYMAEKIGRHSLWIKKQIKKMNIEPLIRRDSVGKVTRFYPQSVLDILYIESNKFENGEGLMTVPMLAKSIGKDREWVISTIAKLNIEGVYRRFEKKGRRGRTYICYPKDTLATLETQTRDCLPPENNWYTLHGLVQILNKSQSWVSKRVKKMDIKPQNRLDTRGALRLHYPPEVYEKLQQLKK
jgi:hypothetical protein